MARLLPLLLCLATLTAFSGCTEDAPRDDGAAGGPDQPADAAGSAPGPDGGASSSDASAASASDGPAGPAVATCEALVNAGAGVAGNLQSAFLACPFERADGSPEEYGSALVEAQWRDPRPTATKFYLYLLSDSCTFQSTPQPCWHELVTSGTGALRLEVDGRLLRDAGRDGLRAWTGMDGVAVQQEVAIAVTLVPAGQALPMDYTALP